ncbi:MAG: hypothetical protein H7Y16_09670 [Candidatus Parcubacteria bacterium]|nr:hypothetical protein [Burkholderiales bacterium]
MIRGAARRALTALMSPGLARMRRRQHDLVALVGQLHAARVRALPDRSPLAAAEFKAFSQWGEDGILQYLVDKVPLSTRWFVEFGVEDYFEANTRFLLVNDNWAGMVLDGSESNIAAIRRDELSWRHQLDARHCFVTRDNIDGLIRSAAPDEDIGLLSVDIDGNDYWVWQAIRSVRPRIVVVEYNSVFGPELEVTIPYLEDFQRLQAHHSTLYWGASLAALCRLAAAKGYDFVGSNSAGNNAFFVRSDLSQRLRKLSPAEGYVESRFRESKSPSGELTFAGGIDRIRLIAHLPVVDVSSDRTAPLGELLK